MKNYKKSRPRKFGHLQEWLRDYLENSSVAGCAYYVAFETRPKERIFWLVVHISSVIFVVTMTLEATLAYTSSPTVTTQETTNYPVQNIDFPGIAICDVNKINYSMALNVATEIMGYDRSGNFTHREITDMLKYLGHLYLFELNDGEEDLVNLLHRILAKQYKDYVRDVVSQLKPDCRSILQRCSWDGKEQACGDLFFTRKTGDGFCCTFNYARQSDDFGSQVGGDETLSTGGIEHTRAIGSQYGLTVILRSKIEDDFYKILPVLGFKILLFSSRDYPDAPSGSLHEILVSPRTESSMSLQATTFYSVPEVSMYDVHDRDCLFSNEQAQKFNGYYSYSDCIMYCRIFDIIKFCQCVPFFYPIPSDAGPVKTCDLKDLRCLKKHRSEYVDKKIENRRSKRAIQCEMNHRLTLTVANLAQKFSPHRWWRVKPRFEESMVPFEDVHPNSPEGVLDCVECRPACADVGYQVSVSSVPLRIGEVIMGNQPLTVDNHSIVNIFYKRAGTIRLKQDVLFYWYELMSNYGGICGFFLGISLISIVEMFYFFTLRLYKRKDDKGKEGNSRLTFVKAAKPSLRPLYWHEMIQPKDKY